MAKSGWDDLDVSQPVGLEMEFEVLQEGHYLMPFYALSNGQNVKAFSTIDQSGWKGSGISAIAQA